MEYKNPFFWDIDAYKRDFDILGNYKKTVSQHIAKMKDWSFEDAQKSVNLMLNRIFPVKSPEMHVLRREVRQDRRKTKIDFLKYIDWVAENKHLLTPNLITYCNPEQERSMYAGFIDENLARRSQVKKDGHRAEMDGDDEFAEFCNLLQANYKIRNNSISGATSSAHNPMYYMCMHTTLTSFCRAMTTTANAINEKMLASNRHYFTPEVTLSNMAYVSREADINLIAQVMDQHNLSAPSVDFVYNEILASTSLYWHSDKHHARIRQFLDNCTQYELAAIAFCGDMYALQRVNNAAMRKFYSVMLTLPVRQDPSPDAVFKDTEEDLMVLVSALSAEWLRGGSWDTVKENQPEIYARTASRILNIKTLLMEYGDLIRAFFSNSIMPQNLHQFTSVVRKGVPGSDTDSSIFTCQNQVKWYTGSYNITDEIIPLTGVTTFIVSQVTAHNLALLCAQIGVEKDQLFRATMKTEFQFNIFAVTPKTKHYMATKEFKEGVVYDKPKYEIKGVNMKNSKLPPTIRKVLEDYQHGLLSKLKNNEEITPQQLMGVIAATEHYISEDLDRGSATWFKMQQIKTKATYRSMATYKFVPFWNHVFGPKYGYVEQLPNVFIEVQVDLADKDALKNWIESMPSDMAQRCREALGHEEYGFPNGMTRIMVPCDLLDNNTLPDEIRPIISKRRILYSMTQPFYLTLTTTSFYVVDKKLSVLASDLMTKEQATRHNWIAMPE